MKDVPKTPHFPGTGGNIFKLSMLVVYVYVCVCVGAMRWNFQEPRGSNHSTARAMHKRTQAWQESQEREREIEKEIERDRERESERERKS